MVCCSTRHIHKLATLQSIDICLGSNWNDANWDDKKMQLDISLFWQCLEQYHKVYDVVWITL